MAKGKFFSKKISVQAKSGNIICYLPSPISEILYNLTFWGENFWSLGMNLCYVLRIETLKIYNNPVRAGGKRSKIFWYAKISCVWTAVLAYHSIVLMTKLKGFYQKNYQS